MMSNKRTPKGAQKNEKLNLVRLLEITLLSKDKSSKCFDGVHKKVVKILALLPTKKTNTTSKLTTKVSAKGFTSNP